MRHAQTGFRCRSRTRQTYNEAGAALRRPNRTASAKCARLQPELAEQKVRHHAAPELQQDRPRE